MQKKKNQIEINLVAWQIVQVKSGIWAFPKGIGYGPGLLWLMQKGEFISHPLF